MKLLRSIKYLFSIFQIVLVISSFSPNTVLAKEQSFDNCFKKNNFICGNPYDFFLKQGIDLNKDILQIATLKMQKKEPGIKFKGIYTDSSKNIYYVKQANPVRELMGSRLVNLILGTKRTPIVKIVNDQIYTVASLELHNFKTKKKIGPHHTLLGEAELAVVENFIALGDSHNKNEGGVGKSTDKLIAARVDYDDSFRFGVSRSGKNSPKANHLNLKLLYDSINKYPKDEIVSAIKKVTSVPDEKIVMTIFQSWALLQQAGYVLDLKHCLEFAHQLIERKNAFRDALKDPHSIANELIQKKHDANKKAAHNLKKKRSKKKS